MTGQVAGDARLAPMHFAVILFGRRFYQVFTRRLVLGNGKSSYGSFEGLAGMTKSAELRDLHRF